MDWPRARAILLAAFTVVNMILAYSIWGPTGLFPDLTDRPQGQTLNQIRETLLNRKLILPTTVSLPRTPEPMKFLRVELPPTPDIMQWSAEISGISPANVAHADTTAYENLGPSTEPDTGALVFTPKATGLAAREVKLDNREQVQKFAEEYLRAIVALPPGAQFSGITERKDKGTVVVEFVPYFEGRPVYSGYVRAEVSARGIERVTRLWVVPKGYTSAPAKQVRPASEALLRLAGRLSTQKPLTITDVQLGYYAGRTLSPGPSDEVHGWDTVPVWRITLDNGETFYINAFNGEWES